MKIKFSLGILAASVAVICFTACHTNSSTHGIPGGVNNESAATEAHSGSNHGNHSTTMTTDNSEGQMHDGTEDMEGMESLGANLDFAQGSWAWGLLDFAKSGSGSKTFILDKVPFEGDDISVEGTEQLDNLALILSTYPDWNIEIQGHTKEAKNGIARTAAKAASKARAMWVQEKIRARGVSGKQMSTKGLGDDELLSGVPADDDSQKRIAIVLSK